MPLSDRTANVQSACGAHLRIHCSPVTKPAGVFVCCKFELLSESNQQLLQPRSAKVPEMFPTPSKYSIMSIGLEHSYLGDPLAAKQAKSAMASEQM